MPVGPAQEERLLPPGSGSRGRPSTVSCGIRGHWSRVRGVALIHGFRQDQAMEGSGMRRLMQNLLLAAVILSAGCLVTACAQSAHGAVTASSPSAGAPATATALPTPTTASPTTPPTTARPTAVPDTASTAPSPSPSSSSTSTTGFSFNLIWLWVALGALVLLGIILLATRSPARADRK